MRTRLEFIQYLIDHSDEDPAFVEELISEATEIRLHGYDRDTKQYEVDEQSAYDECTALYKANLLTDQAIETIARKFRVGAECLKRDCALGEIYMAGGVQ